MLTNTAMPGTGSPNWEIATIGDFDGEGRSADLLLWRNAVTGQKRIWLMNGSSIVSNQAIGTVGDVDFHVVP